MTSPAVPDPDPVSAATIPPGAAAARVLRYGLLVAIGVLLWPYLPGLIGSLVIFAVAWPIVRRMDASGSARRSASLVALFATLLLIVLPGLWLLTELAAQIPDAVAAIGSSSGVQRLLALPIMDVAIGERLRGASESLIGWSSRLTVSILGSMLDAVLNLTIAMFGAYYLLTAPATLWPSVREMLPFGPATSELLRIRVRRTTEAMLWGVVLTGVAQGTIVGIMFALIGFQNAVFWGGITALASVLPLFGSGLVWGPAVAILLVQERLLAAALLAAVGGLIVSNVDNALRLVVYRRISQIHPMVTLVGAFAGVRVFGLSGLLIGPLLVSFTIELFAVARIEARAAAAAAAAAQEQAP